MKGKGEIMRSEKHVKVFRCDNCGKTIESSFEENYYTDVAKNQQWSINLGRAGYGSSLDGLEIAFDLCDTCLANLINNMKHKEVVIKNDYSDDYIEAMSVAYRAEETIIYGEENAI